FLERGLFQTFLSLAYDFFRILRFPLIELNYLAGKPIKTALTPTVFCQNPHHASGCIAIHPLRIHLRRFAGFSPGKLWFSSPSPVKRAERALRVRVMRRYGKSVSV
ncbi:hypothetical protein, partial [Enterobacter roggenkampii]